MEATVIAGRWPQELRTEAQVQVRGAGPQGPRPLKGVEALRVTPDLLQFHLGPQIHAQVPLKGGPRYIGGVIFLTNNAVKLSVPQNRCCLFSRL